MKNLILFLAVIACNAQLWGNKLVLIPTENITQTRQLLDNPKVKVHFYNDDFSIATTANSLKEGMVILDHAPCMSSNSYYIVYTDTHTDKQAYKSSIAHRAEILYSGNHFYLIKTDEQKHGQLPPAKNDGMVRIFSTQAQMAAPRNWTKSLKNLEPDPFVLELLDQVNATYITTRVQHLEDYGTRDAYTPESIEAQQWIEEQFLSWGLEVEVMDFTMPGGPASDNVIATLTGTKYPDEYVIVGGHYDSISWSGDAPGADDNASGTSGVMEIARILSNYTFDRTIVFCAFSGEEYGLYGSAAYASQSAQQGKDILGYFNMDMIGYLKPGELNMMTSLIYPQSAQELADFYTQVVGVYLPNFQVVPATLTGGDSDHTSFNNNGYMGIFPFEDVDNYSPYIHTPDDVVGLSYNNENLAVVFTKAALASVVTMANLLNPPRNLIALPGNEKVELSWDEMMDIDFFNVYKNGQIIETTLTPYYTDYDVVNGTLYEYYVTAIYTETGEESAPSNKVAVTPMPPMELPFFIDFENGTPYWDLDDMWGLSTLQAYSPLHSLSESPQGNYNNNRHDMAILQPFGLMGYSDASLSFQTRYAIENNWDFMYLEISTDGHNWTTIDSYTGNQNQWTLKTYPLTHVLNQPFVQIRFRFSSDHIINDEGMYIDDFQIMVEGGYDTQTLEIPAGWSGISSLINPANSAVADIFQPVNDQMIILQNMEQVYWPDQNINTLGSWDTHSGYKIKMNQPVTLEIQGFFTENNTVSVSEGWNLLPVLSSCAVSSEDLLSEMPEPGEVIIKEIAGYNLYWPAQNIHTLQELMPGKAYMAYVPQAFELEFPACENKAQRYLAKKMMQMKSLPQEITPTGISHLIALPEDANQIFENGDFVGVYTQEGICAGGIIIDHGQPKQALVVFANDSITHEKNGFYENEVFSFKYHHGASGHTYLLEPVFHDHFSHGEYFAPEGVSALESLTLATSVASTDNRITRVYPNPASDIIHIQLPQYQTARVSVTLLSGQLLKQVTMKESSTIRLSGLSEGVYLIHIEGESFREVHKLVRQK